MNTLKKDGYHAFLLRIWSETRQGAKQVWRFVLLDTKSGKRQGFQSLNALFDFLRALTRATEKDDKEGINSIDL